jgi:hypothetical protein
MQLGAVMIFRQMMFGTKNMATPSACEWDFLQGLPAVMTTAHSGVLLG